MGRVRPEVAEEPGAPALEPGHHVLDGEQGANVAHPFTVRILTYRVARCSPSA